MGLLGFPSADEMSSMMGFVTDEDRAKWDSMKQRSDAELAKRGSAEGVASKGVNPALGFAEKSINAQMHGEQMAVRERARKEGETQVEVVETRRKTHFIPNDDEPSSKRDDGPEFG